MSALKSKVPEDAFYQNPFGVDEADDVEMVDQDHDMFCSFSYVRHRVTCTTSTDGNFTYQWWPMFSTSSIRSSVGPASVWGYNSPQWSSAFDTDFSHYRIMGAGIKVVPIMSADAGAGEIVGGMWYQRPSVPTVDDDEPYTYQYSTGILNNIPSTAITQLRELRGTIEASATSGLSVNWRHLKLFNFNTQAVVQPDNGAAPAGGLIEWNYWNYDPHVFWPTSMTGASTYYGVSQDGTTVQYRCLEQFPSLVVCGSGLPISTNVCMIEFVLGVCGVARTAAKASRTPMTVFLGSSLVDDQMSSVPSRKEALRKALTERAEARGAKVWKTLDVASTVLRSLAPLGMMVNPAIGGAMGGASLATQAMATQVKNFYQN